MKKTEYYYERGRSHSRTEIVDKTKLTANLKSFLKYIKKILT